MAAEFPGAIRRIFCRGGEVNRSHSTGSPVFCLEEDEERRERRRARVEGGCRRNEQVSQAWRQRRWMSNSPCSVSFSCSSVRFLFPLYARAHASGQFEITLSPSQCVQSKLQFKSSLARPSSSLCHSCRSTGIRNTENSSSVNPTID